MPIRRYKNLDTNLNGLYEGILDDLLDLKQLKVVNELRDKIKGKAFLSITAVRRSVQIHFSGTIREITITLFGEPNDFILETHVGFWGGLGMVNTLRKGFVDIGYRNQFHKKIRERVKANSKKELTLDKVEFLDSFPVQIFEE